jgi:outer membrane protein OmpA-like peptidoglycan-associated protein
MSVKLKDGKWSPPINLGDSINTPGNEMAPMLHPDGKTLYFSSEGHTGLGQSDLFYSRKDETGRWSKAQNLGYPINSQYNEINMFIDLEGKQALFSSDRPGGQGKTDIYTFDVYTEMAPGKVSFVKGIVTDKESGQPISAQVILTDLATGNLEDSTFSDQVTGEFLMVLKPKINYAFNISAKGYLFFSENFNLADSLTSKPVEKVFELSPVKSGESFVLQNVFFDFNSSLLKPESYSELNKLAEFIKSNPAMRIKIEGHTDNIGDTEYNLRLSEDRAEAVYLYLAENGIDKARMEFEGFGASQPLSSNDSEKGRAQNRRTEVTVL